MKRPRTRRQWYIRMLDALERAYESATSRAFERARVRTVELAALAAQAEALAIRLRRLADGVALDPVRRDALRTSRKR